MQSSVLKKDPRLYCFSLPIASSWTLMYIEFICYVIHYRQNPFFSINTTSCDLQYLRLPYLVERIKVMHAVFRRLLPYLIGDLGENQIFYCRSTQYYYSKKFEQDCTILTGSYSSHKYWNLNLKYCAYNFISTIFIINFTTFRRNMLTTFYPTNF